MSMFVGNVGGQRDLFLHKLGVAVTMEKTILDMLRQLGDQANDRELAEALREHRGETAHHVTNLELAFQALGAETADLPCPAIEGLRKEGQSNLKMVDDSLNDKVILSGVVETEHYEIAVYEGLITEAEAMGEQDVVAVLQENLESEEATLKKAKKMSRQLAKRTARAV